MSKPDNNVMYLLIVPVSKSTFSNIIKISKYIYLRVTGNFVSSLYLLICVYIDVDFLVDVDNNCRLLVVNCSNTQISPAICCNHTTERCGNDR